MAFATSGNWAPVFTAPRAAGSCFGATSVSAAAGVFGSNLGNSAVGSGIAPPASFTAQSSAAGGVTFFSPDTVLGFFGEGTGSGNPGLSTGGVNGSVFAG